MSIDLRVPALSGHTEWAKHNQPTNFNIMVKHAARVLSESTDGVMKSAAIMVDGRHYDEWTCELCGETGRSPSLSDSGYSQSESQKFLGWIRQHYDYNGPNHISYKNWLEFIEEAIWLAKEADRPILDDFGVPYIMGLQVPNREEMAAGEAGQRVPGFHEPIETTGREVEPSGILPFRPPPPISGTTRGRNHMSESAPITGFTVYDPTPEQVAAIQAIMSGEAPAASKGKKAKDEKPVKTAEEDFVADDEDSSSEPEPVKTYTEKQLNKIGEKDDGRDKLKEIATSLGIDVGRKRVPGIIEAIQAAQIERDEASADDGSVESKDSDDYEEDAPKAKKDKSKGKAKDEKKKGKKKGKKG